jgi:hypothetical protein
MDSGLFGPSWDDIFRILILIVGLVNVVVIIAGILALRRYARVLLDVEQFTREARNYARRERGELSPKPERASEFEQA